MYMYMPPKSHIYIGFCYLQLLYVGQLFCLRSALVIKAFLANLQENEPSISSRPVFVSGPCDRNLAYPSNWTHVHEFRNSIYILIIRAFGKLDIVFVLIVPSSPLMASWKPS